MFIFIYLNSSENFIHDIFSEDQHKILQINIPILGDSLFDNVTTFTNDELWNNPLGKTGSQKCKDVCIGTCVNYGLTGHAMCFPK